MGAPTSTLPPLNGLHEHTLARIAHALQGLRNIYHPDPTPRPKRLIHDAPVPDSGYASAEEDADDGAADASACIPRASPDLDALRADPLERAFAIRWLTGFVARSDAWISSSADGDGAGERAGAVDSAAALLGAFSGGDGGDAALTRSFAFRTPALRDVGVRLNDAPLPRDDHTSVGLQSWASSVVLAKMVCAAPAAFGLGRGGTRVLELGAGTGLVSIAVGKLRERGGDGAEWSVVATDYHADVLCNLAHNVGANFGASPVVEVEVLDWERPDYSAALATSFDVIFGADVIYRRDHGQWIRGCVERLLRPRTGSDPGGVFWLMIPVRLTGRMHETVDAVFRAGSGLVVLGIEEVMREDGVGRVDECGYKLFKIGWEY